jgi:hypothetical protein
MEVKLVLELYVSCLNVLVVVHYVTSVLFFTHNAHIYKRVSHLCDQRSVFLRCWDVTLCYVGRAVDSVEMVER